MISLTISKLYADQRITSHKEVFEFTAEFETFLIKDDLEAQKKNEQKERDRLKYEKGEIKRNREEKLPELANQLLGDGYIKSSSSTPIDLMQIPKFEILVIILENGSVSVQEIKSKAKGVSPVLVSRRIKKLEADEKIKRSDDGKWHLVE
ncbi:MAG: MarR family transcriptional regulator [Candidatus Heimdallarchaeota archaeon]|nr:MarR family transcriptional regulator [Candidatus Heimdallarchaeota archaeon]